MNEYSTKGIIMIPYAELEGYASGINVADQEHRRDIYLKNCCVACLSARENNTVSTDIALVTNIDVPEKYRDLLQKNGVIILTEIFDVFQFDKSYSWSLAFYKLCALYNITRKYNYMYYAYLDSDVFVQGNFDNIWSECEDNVLLYDINHGLQVEHYRHFLSEVNAYLAGVGRITQFGGEFFAASRDNSLIFSDKCLEIFNDMKNKGFTTTHGDEFILSLAAAELRNRVKNAGSYIFRFWTGEFRLVSTCYINNEVAVLHVPDEKEDGMIKLYDMYVARGTIGKGTAHERLHLKRRSVKIELARIKAKLLKG